MHAQRTRAGAPICAQAKPHSGGVRPHLTEERGVRRTDRSASSKGNRRLQQRARDARHPSGQEKIRGQAADDEGVRCWADRSMRPLMRLAQVGSKAFPSSDSAVSLASAQLPRRLTQLAPPCHGHTSEVEVAARCLEATLAELARPATHCPRLRILLNANAIRTPVDRDRPSPARSSDAVRRTRSTLVDGSEVRFGMISPSRRPRER